MLIFLSWVLGPDADEFAIFAPLIV